MLSRTRPRCLAWARFGVLVWVCAAAWLTGPLAPALAQPPGAPERPASEEPPQSETPSPQAEQQTPSQPAEGVPVIYRGKELFRVYAPFGSVTPEERAQLSAQRLDRLVRDIRFRPELVRVVHGPTTSEFVFRDQVIGVVTDDDARAAGRDRRELAEELLATVQRVVIETRADLGWESVLFGLGYAAAATLFLAGLLWLLRRVNRRLRRRIRGWSGRRERGLGFHRLELLTVERAAALMEFGVRVTTLVASVMLLFAWLEAVLAALPWTRPHAALVIQYLEAPVAMLWGGVVAALPNLFYLLVITAGAYGALKLVHFFFREIERGTVSLGTFRPEWAEPTYKLVRLFILALAFVAAFPYIPGSGSPAFQGVSVFLGVLISISSSSVISNVLAGAVLTYTGAFRLGDRIRIGDALGDVVDKTLFVTRLRTTKDVVVSIPNNTVLTSNVLNYSTLANGRGVVLHTAVTIGYDAPWRRVHELLIEAARATEGVLEEPAPFVLQTSLDDFFVTYEINVYTRMPTRMARIYSDLHANIQEAFNKAGVEIMSPHFTSLRDGNRTTIPETHLPAGYEAPAFQVRGTIDSDDTSAGAGSASKAEETAASPRNRTTASS